MEENNDLIDLLFDPGYVSGVSTGFLEVDKISGGLKKGQLIVLAGSAGMGKSILGLTILVNVAKSGVPTLYFDLENGKEESFRRILQGWYGLSPDFFRDSKNKKATEKMLSEIDANLDYWGTDELLEFGYLKDGWQTLEKIIRAGGREKKYKPRVIVIDPLQALETSTEPGKALLEQGEIIKHFKELAQKLNITIVVCHHLRKGQYTGGDYIASLDDLGEIKYRVPTLEDLKGSSKIGDFAQCVWGLVRTKDSNNKENRSRSLLRILKNRNGLSGDIGLYFDEDKLCFKDRPVIDFGQFDNTLLSESFHCS